jgi:hypothetical protein
MADSSLPQLCVFPISSETACGQTWDAPIHHEPGLMRHNFTLRYDMQPVKDFDFDNIKGSHHNA